MRALSLHSVWTAAAALVNTVHSSYVTTPALPFKLHDPTPPTNQPTTQCGTSGLDLLKLPPAGSWKPSINISTLLSSLQLLMNEPNPDDPLMTDIAEEYRHHREAFLATAKAWTAKHAVDDADDAAAATDESSSEDESDSEDDEEGEEEQDAVRVRRHHFLTIFQLYTTPRAPV